MKRTVFRLLAVVALLGFVAACGGGGDDDKGYEFGGRWAWDALVTASNVPGAVGDRMLDVMTITQSGNTVTVTFPPDDGTFIVMSGSCDPKARTFSATGVSTGAVPGIRFDIMGAAVDDDTMSGNFAQVYGPAAISGTWTAGLVGRSIAAPAGGGPAGALHRLLRAPR